MSRKAAAAALLLVCASIYFATNVVAPARTMAQVSDFTHYYAAGKAVLHGQSPYTYIEYLYPPLLAILTAPFALVDYETARWIWFVLSHGFLLGAGVLVWRAAGRDVLALCCVAFVWGFGWAAGETLALGQIGPLLVFMLAIAYLRAGVQQGAAIGLGFSLKYFPGVMLVGAFLARDRRAMVATVVAVVLLVIAPWYALSKFDGPKSPRNADFWMGTSDLWSWSIPSTVLRALDPPAPGSRAVPYNWDYGNMAATIHPIPRWHRYVSLAAAAATLAAGVLALAWICRLRLSAAQLPWAQAGLISLVLAASPVCWTHYQILQYPGVALLLTGAVRRRTWFRAAAILACSALLYALPMFVLTRYRSIHGGWTTASTPTLYLCSTIAPLASLGLFVLFLIAVRETAAEPVPRAFTIETA